MADDQSKRPFAADPAARRAQNDPLAELARLIGQTDPFSEFGRDKARHPEAAPASAPRAMPEPPPAQVSFGSNEYFGTTTAAVQPIAAPPTAHEAHEAHEVHEAHEAYAEPAYGADADVYHPDSPVPGYPAHAQDQAYDDANYHPPQPAGADADYYDEAPPPRRRMNIMAIAAVFALAVLGTAGAFGYRALFGSTSSNKPPPVIKADATPSKIVPAAASKTPGKLTYDRVPDRPQNEKIVSREEQPVEMKDKDKIAALAAEPGTPDAQPAASQSALGNGVISDAPKKVRTISIRPDQMGDGQPAAAAPMAAPAKSPSPPPAPIASNPPAIHPQAAPAPVPRPPEPRPAAPVHHAAAPAPSNAPLSLNPNAQPPAPAARAPMRTASAPTSVSPAAVSRASSGGYAVQVSSQRSEADAQAAFRGLQAKYPQQLGGRQMMIHKVDLGAKGTYYRALVGPFASAGEASTWCSGLKAAGGQCFIQRN